MAASMKMAVFLVAVVWCRIVWQKFTDVSGVLMMEAASTSETLVNFYQTTIWRNNPEDSHLHTSKCVRDFTFHGSLCACIAQTNPLLIKQINSTDVTLHRDRVLIDS
jgi:hypothetical protein